MTWNIEYLVKGGKPTLLHTGKGNQLIGAVNALGNMTIEPGNYDQVVYSQDSVRLVYRRMPLGYYEKEVTICEDGEENTYIFLVRDSG